MGISGLWAQRAAHDYTGATKWGNGADPVHAIADTGRGRVLGTKENLYPLGEPSDVVSSDLTSRDIDWLCEDYNDAPTEGETFRYQDERPNWGMVTTQFREDTNNQAMGEQPAWGVYFDSDVTGEFPVPGPTGGSQRWLDVNHGELTERQRAIDVPTRFVSGGWLNKARTAPAVAESQDPTQPEFVWTINTAAVQGPGLKQLANDRAVQRGTDTLRSAVPSRTAGAVTKVWGQSAEMGGGSGAPNMDPYQQTPGLRRPWFNRVASLPPAEKHFMNTMEGRVPLQRTVAADPYQGDSEIGVSDAGADWGY